MSDDLPKQPKPTQATGSLAKESAPPVGHIEAPLITEIGKEVELPPEVAKAGVAVKSDSVVLPQSVQQMGVTGVGTQEAPPLAATAIAVPLTDDQIAQGLKESLTSSWRWLAQWCKRQLQMFIRK